MFFFLSVVVPCHLHVLLCSDQFFLHYSHFVPVVYQLVVVVLCCLHVLLCSDQLFLQHSHFVPVVYQLVKFHGVVLFQIQLHKEIL